MKVEKYEGPLSYAQIVRGYQYCIKNARELYSDAELLFKNRRYARAYALTVLSYEEIGKLMILLTATFHESSDLDLWKKFWNRFRSHTLKRTRVSLMELLSLPNTTWEQMEREWEREPLTERLKQLALYVDWFDGRITLPSKLYSKPNLPEAAMKLARDRIEHFSKVFSGRDDPSLRKRTRWMKKEGLANSKGMTEKGMEWLENQLKEMATSLRELASTPIQPNST